MVAVAPPSHACADSADAAFRFEAMFERHHDAVWRTLRRFGVAESHVDDATQRVFLVAARRLDEVRAGEERRFLYGVAMRIASEIRRRDPSRFHVADDEILERIPDHAHNPEMLLIEHDARRALDEALAAMADDLRQILVLVELESVSLAQLATLLDIPVGTAASRLRRAREAFAESARRVRARLAGGVR